MRISRIARHGAFRDASASAQTFETVNVTIINPSYFEEIVAVKLTRSTENIRRKHIQGF